MSCKNRFAREDAEEIRIRDVVINEKKRTVYKNGTEIPMQPMEFDCLLVFWKYRNRVMTRDQILNILWGVDFEGESRTVDVHVGNIRKNVHTHQKFQHFKRLNNIILRPVS